MKLFSYFLIFSLSLLSLASLADCPDANAVLCQNTQNPRERQTLSVAKFGTCWQWSNLSCGFCGNTKQEKDQECRNKVGQGFEARTPMFGE